MELLLAVFVAGPLGYFTRSVRRGLTLYLVLFAIVLPVEAVVVYRSTDGDGGSSAPYWIVNVVILGVGIGLNLLGARLRERRRGRRTAVSELT